MNTDTHRLCFKMAVTALLFAVYALVVPAPLTAELKIGDKAPPVIARNRGGSLVFGKTVLAERPILLSFFFTGCAPCKKELPHLEQLHRRQKETLQIYIVATDKDGVDVVGPFVESLGLTMDVLVDQYSDLARAYNVSRYPSTFIVGKDGRIVYFSSGYSESTLKEVEKAITGLK